MAQEKYIINTRARMSRWHILGIICSVIFFLAAFDAQAATLFIDPASLQSVVGDTFEAVLRVDTQGQAINAIEAAVTYPVATLTGVSISRTNSILTVWAEGPTLDAGSGTIRFAGGRPSPGFTGIGEILRITFRGSAVSQASVAISEGSVLANDGNGTELLNTRRGSLFTIVAAPIQNPPAEPEPEPAPAPQQPEPAPPESITTPSPEEPVVPPEGAVDTFTPVPISTLIGEASDLVETFTDFEVPASFSGVPETLGTVPVTFTLSQPAERAVDIIVSAVPIQVSEAVREVKNIIQATKTYQKLDAQVINNPIVEAANVKVALPVLITAAATNISLGVRIASLFTYLQWLTTQPLFLLTRRKRKRWGMVYSSLTKLPVDLAVVRLFDQNSKLLQTRVTDKQGRYLFFVDAGTYRIGVTKPGFIFPSVFLKDKSSDLDFTDLYHQEPIVATEKGTAIARPIPVDSVEKVETSRRTVTRKLKRGFQKTIAWSGPMFAVVSVAITPTRLTFGFLVFQILLLGLFRRLSERKPPESWGLVVDDTTAKPIAFAIMRIFDSTYNKLLETQITDRRGRYAFLVGKGVFYITAEKQDYATYKSATIDLSKGEKGKIVKSNIRLVPQIGPPVVHQTPDTPPPPASPVPETPADSPPPAPPSLPPPHSPPAPPSPPPLAPDLDPLDPADKK